MIAIADGGEETERTETQREVLVVEEIS